MISKSIIDHLDSLQPGTGLYFQEQLTLISTEVLRTKLPTLNGLSLFAIKTDVPAGAKSFKRVIYDHVGSAEFIANYGDDLKRVDVVADEEEILFKSVGDAFGYSVDDIAAAAAARQIGRGPSIDLSTEKALAARKFIEKKLNDIVWKGSPKEKLYGILNHPAYPRYAMPNTTSAAVDTLAADICAAFYSVQDDTNQVEKPDRIILAARVRNTLSTRYRANTDLTLLDMVAGSCGITTEKIIGVHELDRAGEVGGDLMIIDRKDPLIAQHILPTPFEQLPPEARNLEYVINCIARTGGIMSMYPQGLRICEFPA